MALVAKAKPTRMFKSIVLGVHRNSGKYERSQCFFLHTLLCKAATPSFMWIYILMPCEGLLLSVSSSRSSQTKAFSLMRIWCTSTGSLNSRFETNPSAVTMIRGYISSFVARRSRKSPPNISAWFYAMVLLLGSVGPPTWDLFLWRKLEYKLELHAAVY